MEREKIERLFYKTIGENSFKEMILTQLLSWELCLQKKKLAEKTIERKIKNILDFYVFLNKSRGGDKNKRIRATAINDLCFEFVRDGLYNIDNIENEGVKEYRESIYYNVQTGMNYIFENYFDGIKEVVKPLTNEQREILEDISKNKFFKVSSIRDDNEENFYDNLQIKIIEQLGIKIYFDDNNKAYALSHELSELIGKQNKDTMKAIRLLKEREEKRLSEKNRPISEASYYKVLDDFYYIKGNGTATLKRETLKIYKDLLMVYVLGLNGEKYTDFKFDYVDAFNYIEQQYNKLLIEHGKLKESFYNMYNEIRKRNRDLLVDDFNKKVKTKKKAS